jgi:hypothetical protein
LTLMMSKMAMLKTWFSRCALASSKVDAFVTMH